MIKDRIVKILEDEGINPSTFADEIGVQRSSISHILSNRNKPSLDIITKILSRYRNIDSEWLIMGRGTPYKSDKNINKEEVNTPPDQSITDISTATTLPFGNMPSEDLPSETTIKKHKTVEKIVIFYSDNSYEEFYASKKE